MKIEQKCINTARVVSAEVIANANSGHTGVALSAATILFALFKDHLTFSTNDNLFLNRDRLILSAGHASALLYTLEHMFGFPISLEDLKDFRKYDSITPGHPHFGLTPGVEVTTGPLGQGIANGVGMAIAQSMLAERFNVLDDPIFDNYTYVFAGDGCLMEGVALEAISLAGTLQLNKLIVLYDYNKMTIDGSLSQTNAEDVAAKFRAQNWNVIHVKNGNNYKKVTKAIAKAKLSTKPCIIIFNTVLGYESDYANNPVIHSKALKLDEVSFLRKKLQLDGQAFDISADVLEVCSKSRLKNEEIEMNWRKKVNLYSKTNPELYKQLSIFIDVKTVDVEKLVGNKIKDKKISGRLANNIILNLIADKMPNLVGGSADLASATMAKIGEEDDIYGVDNRRGRNIAFGVREHCMAAIANGISLYAGLKVFVSTFLSFSNYMLPAIRLSAMMQQPVIYIFTHDSVFVGEDGATHQPIEQLAQLRQIPDLNVCRPCDTKELIASYNLALNGNLPTCLVLSKQDLTEQKTDAAKASKGAYVLEKDSGKLQFVLYATGSEVELALNIKKEFNKNGVSGAVVSFPCIEEFERQTESYKNTTLIKSCKFRFAIEASSDNVWYKYIGDDGKVFNVTKYGKSGKGSEVYRRMGFNVAAIKKEISKIIKK